MPRVFERRYLRIGLDAGFVFEKYVVIAVGIKRWVKIDEINRLVLDLFPQDLQIVAVVKGVQGKSATDYNTGLCSAKIL